jgi:type I restriction enzyme S subunit
MGNKQANSHLGIPLPFDIPDDWESSPLLSCCEFIKDGDWIETKDQSGNAYRLLQISNIGVGRFIETGNYRWITKETFNRLNCTEIQINDVLVARMPEPTGRAWFVNSLPWPSITAVDVAIIRTNKALLEPRFLAYCFNSRPFLLLIDNLSTGTTRRRIKRKDLELLRVPIPPLPEQRAIAHILGTLDDQIETLRRMNETLEGIARALFKAWFVDFEPVRAKMSGRWRRGQSLPGLPADLYDLFPDTLIPSELGQIPQGWQIKSLDEIADFLNGLALQKYPPEGSEFLPVIKIRELRDGQPDNASDKASVNIPKEYVINDGDVIFSWSGSLLLQIWHGGKGALNQHLFKVTSSQYPKWFYYHWIDEHLPAFQRIAASKATTMGHIQRHHLSEAKVVAPPKAQLKVMSEIMQPLLNKRTENAIQSRTLAALRDALLPELISGRLRLADAERFLQARGL